MDNQTRVCLHNEVLFGNEKETSISLKNHEMAEARQKRRPFYVTPFP
jgi:hypothetical protein